MRDLFQMKFDMNQKINNPNLVSGAEFAESVSQESGVSSTCNGVVLQTVRVGRVPCLVCVCPVNIVIMQTSVWCKMCVCKPTPGQSGGTKQTDV